MSTADYTELDLHTSPIDEGLTVIEASAGTGKTYSISHLVPRLLLTGILPDVSKLLLVTFTNDAARELADRVRRVLTRLAAPPAPEEAEKDPGIAGLRALLAEPGARRRLDCALLDLDLLAVSTIHAFCQRTLQAEGSLCGVPVMPEVITDDSLHLDPLIRDEWLRTLGHDPVLAAIATAHGWNLGDTVSVVKACRKVAGLDRVQPTPTPFNTLRAELDARLSPLRDASAVTELDRCLAGASWKGGATLAGVREALRPAFGTGTDTCEFWAAIRFAAELEAKLGARGNAQKAARAAVLDCRWVVAALQVQNTLSALRWSLQLAIAETVKPRLVAVLESRRLITQDGLIETLYQALHRPDGAGAEQSRRLADHLAGKYYVALIDESQDTDPRQFAIFSRIFLQGAPRRRLILVGDPKQAIYGFRGADVATYLRARDAAGRRYTLTRTHRAPAPLVQAVNACFSRERAFHHAGMRFLPAQSALAYDWQLYRSGQPCSRLEVWLADAADPEFSRSGQRVGAVSARIASTIVDLLENAELRKAATSGGPGEVRPVRSSDCAVLVADNRQAQVMAEALLERGVPAVVASGADVFLSEEAQDLRIVFRAILEPRRTQRVRAALATRLLGLDAAELMRLDAECEGASGSGEFSAWSERFQHWHRVWHTRGLAALLAALEGDAEGTLPGTLGRFTPVSHRLAVLPLTGERRVTNYRHVTDLLLDASRTEVSRPAELVRWLGQQIARAELRCDAEERQLQLSTDRAAVQVVTMHKAKGLEYPLVFCPYLADSIKRSKGLLHLPDIPGEPADTLWNIDQLDTAAGAQRSGQKLAADMEERLRLAYVALTRAQARVWTCSYTPSVPRFDLGSPLDWLLRPSADISAYSEYSDAWLTPLRPARAQKHAQALAEIGARPAEEESNALITVCAPPEPHSRRYTPNQPEAATTVAAAIAPSIPSTWRVTSFSSLTREKHAHGTPIPNVESGSAVASLGAEPTSVDVGPADPPLSFFTAPGGAAIGTAVHDWIETWDFGGVDAMRLRQHLTFARLPALAEGTWDSTLTELFGAVPKVLLPGFATLRLGELCREAHASEWHFHLPLADTLGAADLARCFAEHAAPEHRGYAPVLAALSEEKFRGLLQGFIDRLVRHENRWGVIDWKTNRLGGALSDYGPDALLKCAMDDHYLLQMHLYLVALRRYLRAIGVDNPVLAGAWLVFLRAIEPETSRGILHVNPPPAMLDALETLFAPPALAVA